MFTRALQSLRSIGLLGLLQTATLVALGLGFLASLFLLHHETDDYFTPLPSYLSSFKIAVPPVAVFALSYVIAFLTGTALSDVPKAVLGFARNVFFQSCALMIAVTLGCLAFVGYSATKSLRSTPPAYEQFVKLLLSGSSDNLVLAREKVEGIRKLDPAGAARFAKVVEVFAERSAVNAGQKPLSGERARTLVRALAAEEDPDWTDHPFRLHGLAEAYSLFGQSVLQAAGLVAVERPHEPEAPYRKAVELYDRVSSSQSPLAPAALKASAQANTGNAHYYMGNYAAALTAWRAASADPTGQPNLNPWSNVVAALVLLNDPAAAIAEGEKARAWAERSGKALVETYSFAGLLENTAFARLETGDTAGAVADFATAHAFREDNLTRQNLALALVVSGRPGPARTLLSQITPQLAVGTSPSPKIAPCVYLIWSLAMVGDPPADRAANLLAFLAERRSVGELNAMTEAGLRDILRRTGTVLPKVDPPCGSLGKIKAVMQLLAPDDPRSLGAGVAGEPAAKPVEADPLVRSNVVPDRRSNQQP